MDGCRTEDKVEYVVAAICEFAKRHGMSRKGAYLYLKKFKGIEMLDRFYDTMHTLRFEDVTDDLAALCRRHGGTLA